MPSALKKIEDENLLTTLSSTNRIFDSTMFSDIVDSLAQLEECTKAIDNYKRKLEKLKTTSEQATESIARCTEKIDYCQRRNESLKKTIADEESRRHESLKYWHDMGLDIKEATKETDKDEGEKYEFIYTKLHPQQTSPFKVVLSFKDRQLNIVSLSPENIMNQEQLDHLRSTLTSTNVSPSGNVNWRQAMLAIRRILTKNLMTDS